MAISLHWHLGSSTTASSFIRFTQHVRQVYRLHLDYVHEVRAVCYLPGQKTVVVYYAVQHIGTSRDRTHPPVSDNSDLPAEYSA